MFLPLRLPRRVLLGILALLAAISLVPSAQQPRSSPDPAAFHGCTSIMVGRLASSDGSVITSHTADGRYRTWLNIVPHRTNPPGATSKIYVGRMHTRYPEDERGLEVTGEIPEPPETYAFINTAYPAMNERQVGIGETTIVGRSELRNPKGSLMIEEIERLMLERCSTAREAIRLADELTRKYGYRDYGECLTISDPKEVWHFEIMGATPKHVGAVWAAVRIPDDHVGVSANASRIGELHLERPDDYLASENVHALAEEMGWWNAKDGGAFKFHKAYGGSSSSHTPLREWRVLSLAAPSLNLKPILDELPFSVKVERKISAQDVMAWLRDAYEGTPYDATRNLVVGDKQGNKVKSPVASPWLSPDLRQLLNGLSPNAVTNHYTIANNTCSYSTVIQSRSWLPDPVGGLVWLGFDNPAHSARMPLFAGITDVPPSFKLDNQHGYNNGSAAWAFRRVSRLANARWGKTREPVMRVVNEAEARAFSELPGVEKRALALFARDPKNARAFLTAYSSDFARATTQRYWELGDTLWTLFTYDFALTAEDIEKLK